MSELLFIVLLILVPVVIVVAFLNHLQKKQKQKLESKVADYLHKVMGQTEIIPNYQKQLVHQLLMVDEKNRKLLIIEHRDAMFSHNVLSLDEIKSIRVVHHKETLMPYEKGRKPETFTTHIGIEMIIENTGAQLFLPLYDHVEHDIYRMHELERAAMQLQEHLAKLKYVKPVKA